MLFYEGQEVVTIKNAQRTVGVSRRTIYNWIQKGIIKTVKIASGRTLIIKHTLYKNQN